MQASEFAKICRPKCVPASAAPDAELTTAQRDCLHSCAFKLFEVSRLAAVHMQGEQKAGGGGGGR
jgi:hypothetical protein